MNLNLGVILEVAIGLVFVYLVLAAAAVAVAALGAGKLSLDYALFGSTSFYDLLHGWPGFLIAVTSFCNSDRICRLVRSSLSRPRSRRCIWSPRCSAVRLAS